MVEVTLVLSSTCLFFLQFHVSIIHTDKILPEVVNDDAVAFGGEAMQIPAPRLVTNVFDLMLTSKPSIGFKSLVF